MAKKKTSLRKEGLFGLQFEGKSIVMRQVWQQDHEANGHIGSAVNGSTQFTFSSLFSQHSCLGTGVACI